MSQSSSYSELPPETVQQLTEDRADLVRSTSAWRLLSGTTSAVPGAFFTPYDDLIKRRSDEIVQAARDYFDACEDAGHDGRTRVEWELATAKTQSARERLRLLVKDSTPDPLPTRILGEG